jgi:hypothetical protein
MALGLNEYTFQLNDTGVLLNSDSLGLPFVDVERVQGLDSAPYRETTRDHEGTDGGFMDAEFEKGRDIILEGVAYANTLTFEAYMDSLKANFAPVQNPIPFYVKAPGVVERIIYVKPRGVRYDWDLGRRIGMTSLQLMMFAEDPRFYDAAESVQNINFGGDAGFGFAFSLGFNLNFGGGATPGGLTVNNSGNRSTPVTFIILGPVTNPVISNNTTGHSMGFTITLGASDTLTINSRDRTVYLNGNVNRRNTLTVPDWFDLAVGNNAIGYGGQSGVGSSLQLRYRSAWR